MTAINPLTDDELAAIEARAAAATAGPWEPSVDDADDDFILTGGPEKAGLYLTLTDDGQVIPAPAADVEFVAAARQDVPRLIAELHRLRHG